MLAGHETTAIALTFALHLLGRHPVVQDSVRDEVRAVLGAWSPTSASVAGLPLTTAVLKEAMRLTRRPRSWAGSPSRRTT